MFLLLQLYAGMVKRRWVMYEFTCLIIKQAADETKPFLTIAAAYTVQAFIYSYAVYPSSSRRFVLKRGGRAVYFYKHILCSFFCLFLVLQMCQAGIEYPVFKKFIQLPQGIIVPIAQQLQ